MCLPFCLPKILMSNLGRYDWLDLHQFSLIFDVQEVTTQMAMKKQ